MKPNTRIIDYTVLIQDGVLTLDDVPQDVQSQVTKLVRYLSGVEDNGMVKDTSADKSETVDTTNKPDLSIKASDLTSKAVLSNDSTTIK